MVCSVRAQVTLEEAQAHGPSHMLPATYANPLGRASITRPTPAMFERASVVCPHPKPQTPFPPALLPLFCQHVCSSGAFRPGRCAMLCTLLILLLLSTSAAALFARALRLQPALMLCAGWRTLTSSKCLSSAYGHLNTSTQVRTRVAGDG